MAQYQIPYRIIPRRQIITPYRNVPYSGGKNRIPLTAQMLRNLYTVPYRTTDMLNTVCRDDNEETIYRTVRSFLEYCYRERPWISRAFALYFTSVRRKIRHQHIYLMCLDTIYDCSKQDTRKTNEQRLTWYPRAGTFSTFRWILLCPKWNRLYVKQIVSPDPRLLRGCGWTPWRAEMS